MKSKIWVTGALLLCAALTSLAQQPYSKVITVTYDDDFKIKESVTEVKSGLFFIDNSLLCVAGAPYMILDSTRPPAEGNVRYETYRVFQSGDPAMCILSYRSDHLEMVELWKDSKSCNYYVITALNGQDPPSAARISTRAAAGRRTTN